MFINNNISSMTSIRHLNSTDSKRGKNIEKLSSGMKLNRSSDDAAGLAISEKMRGQIRGLNMASKNSQDAISLIQTADGATQGIHDILQRMSELAVQSSSDTNCDILDREALNDEYLALLDEIDDISDKTEFNGIKLLNGNTTTIHTGQLEVHNVVANGIATNVVVTLNGGSAVTPLPVGDYKITIVASGSTNVTASYEDSSGTVLDSKTYDPSTFPTSAIYHGSWFNSISYGYDVNGTFNTQATYLAQVSEITFSIGEKQTQATSLVIQTGANQGDELDIVIANMSTSSLGIENTNISSRGSAQNAISGVHNAINIVSSERGKMGAYQNRLEFKIQNLDISAENLTAAESRIRDVDMAHEMTDLTKNQILTQTGLSMQAQANSIPQGVLQLING